MALSSYQSLQSGSLMNPSIYINLLKDTISFSLWPEPPRPIGLARSTVSKSFVKRYVVPRVKNFLDGLGMELLAVSQENVAWNFKKDHLLDSQVVFVKGWFKDTLHLAPIDKLAVLRLDGDMYTSTMEALDPLYPKLFPGGYRIVDDYGNVEACKKAVTDYRAKHNITESIIDIDGAGVYWRKAL